MRGQSTTTSMGRAPAGRSSAFPLFRRPSLHSLTLKLTLAFLCTGLTGALLVAVFVAQRTRGAVNQFVVDRDQWALTAALAEHYETRGTWEDVAGAVPRDGFREGGPDTFSGPVVVCDADGRVVLGGGRFPRGARVPASDRARGTPIKVDNTTVGWLLSDLGPRHPGRGTPEAALLDRITEAIKYSAFGAVGLALVLGVLLARTLTQPLRELTAATRAVASGRLGKQVTVRSRDELGALASSFNQMSTDLAQASTLRRQMTADIAHDLRTPLSVILGYTEALRDGKLPGTQEIFDTVYTEAQHLQHLVDDLRTLSLADAGELPLTCQPVQPRTLLERAASAHLAQAQAQRITLVVQAPAALPEVDVDTERMAQVLGNLLSNALRFTPAGGTVTLAAEAHDGAVQLRVRDTGAGIAPDAVSHIFERFYRADPSRQHDGSSGLGLAIAKGIVAAHGGSIVVESDLGEGATFTITLLTANAARHDRDV